MKKLTALLIAILTILSVSAQETVKLTVSGQGKTKEEATANALRSAIEQSFGVFVSANTQILNDEVVKDEIATIASGNIQEYKELGCVTLPNGDQSISLSATVSIGNLISYAKNKGASTEFAGQVFAMNMKMRKLNAENEHRAIINMFEQLKIIAKDMFEVSVDVIGQPKKMDYRSVYELNVESQEFQEYWLGKNQSSITSQPYIINLELKYHTTPLCKEFYNLFFNTLESLSLSKSEIEAYKETNTPYYSFYDLDGSVQLKNCAFTALLAERGYIRGVTVENWRAASHTPDVVSGNGTLLSKLFMSKVDGLKNDAIRVQNERDEIINNIKNKKKLSQALGINDHLLYMATNGELELRNSYVEYIANSKSHFMCGYSGRIPPDKEDELICQLIREDDRDEGLFLHKYTFRTHPEKISTGLAECFAVAQMEAYNIHIQGCDLICFARKPLGGPGWQWETSPKHRLYIGDFVGESNKYPSLHMFAYDDSMLYYTSNVLLVVAEEEISNISGFEIRKRDDSTTHFREVVYTTNNGHPANIMATENRIISNSYNGPSDGCLLVKFMDNVTKLEGWQNTNITSITIPDGVTEIEGAFWGCSSLTTVKIPESVTRIGYRAFYDCSSLATVNIPKSVTKIERGAFGCCTSLETINISKGVTEIGESAFHDCNSLKSITIPDSVTEIGDCAFIRCSSLTSVTIPDSVTSIGDFAFYRCGSLKSITIPNSVTEIGIGAFDGCSSLASVTIPDGVTSIGERVFEGCSSLANTYIDVSDLAKYCENNNIWRNYPGDKHILINGNEITELVVPDSVTEIGDWAFLNCSSLISITIPNSVTKIEVGAFNGCSRLMSVYLKSTTPLRLEGDIRFVLPMCRIYVPAESVDAYKSAWSSVADRIEGYSFDNK